MDFASHPSVVIVSWKRGDASLITGDQLNTLEPISLVFPSALLMGDIEGFFWEMMTLVLNYEDV